jgi:hypothetical protein
MYRLLRSSLSSMSRIVTAVVFMASLLALGAAAPAYATSDVTIGNSATQPNGSYINAQLIANNLVFTSVAYQATSSITVTGPIDLSQSSFGTPQYNLSLIAPVCNIDGNINMAAAGDLFLTCNTINWNGQITSGGSKIAPSRIVSTATQVSVASNSASIQQAIDDSSTTAPVAVQVSPGQYNENLTINRQITLSGVDGSNPTGADPNAPTINGTQSGGNVITVTGNGVEIDGLHLNGTVTGGSPSVDGIFANNVSNFTAAHNTLDGFTGPGIDTTGSTNTVLNANNIIPLPPTQIDVSVNGYQTYGSMFGLFGDRYTGVPGLTISGFVTCTTVNGGTPINSSLGVGNYTIDAGSCSGLSVSDPVHYAITYVSGITGVFVVTAANQGVTFTSTAPTNATVGGSAYSPTASATSGLPVAVTVDPASAGVCSDVSNSVTFQNAGTCTLDANQGGDANHNAATQVQQSFTVSLANQTITFTSTAPSNAFVGGPSYSPTASSTSNLPVTLWVDSSSSSVCSFSGGNVTFQNAGTCVLDANDGGNSSYNAATQVQQSFTVNPASQTVSFTSVAPTNASVGGTVYGPNASATSGLAAAITVDPSATSVCAISGGNVSFLTAGTCVLDANQAGSPNYSAANQAQQSFLVSAANQAITFTIAAPTGASVGGPSYSPTAAATSGLPVSLSVDPSASSVCSLSGGTVSFIGAGLCVLDGNQNGNANYNAAPQVQQSFVVIPANQTVAFTSTAPTGAVVGGPVYSATAFATSGLPAAITVDASASTVCSISGGNVSFQDAGTCVLDANQGGNSNYNAAGQVQQSFSVNPASQTVAFTSTAPTNALVGGPVYAATASATSGLPAAVTVDASAAAICTIVSGNVSFQAAGTCVLDANQGGNASYNAAPQVQQSFVVDPTNQTVAFTSTPDPTALFFRGSTTSYSPTASATSGLPATITADASTATVCSLSGGTLVIENAGTCTLDANQAGNSSYNAAPQVQQSFTIAPANQFVLITSTPPASSVVGTIYTVSGQASSGLAPVFTIDPSTASVCSISGTTVSLLAVGTCTIDANQPGNFDYNAAHQFQQSFTVSAGSQTVAFTSTAPTNALVGGPVYATTASATSGLPAAVTVDASSAAVCAIVSGNVSFQAAGTCVLDANQGGNANYNAAAQVQQTFAVSLANQTVAFTSTAPTNAVVGGPVYSPTASATSGLPAAVTVDGSSSAVCAIVGGNVSFQAAGTCELDVNQGGNGSYRAAAQVEQSFTVGAASQTVAFTSTAPTGAFFHGPAYAPTASATSGLAATITVDSSASSVCTLSGGSVTFQNAGTCTLDANQAGNANYKAAAQVQQSFTVAPVNQVVVFTSTAPTNAVVAGAAYAPAGTATSNLPVAFTVDASSSSVCRITSGNVNFQTAGTCKVDANQAGNGNYNAAPQVQQSFTVHAAAQTLSFTSAAPTNALVGGPAYAVTASATSGLPVAITVDSSASGVCSLSGGNVSFQTAGTCVLDANQGGNASYNAATQVQQSFNVNQKPVFDVDTPATTGMVGQVYSYIFVADGTPTPTYSLATGAPSWLSINATTGQLSGTPPTGTTTFTYSVIAASSVGSATAGPFTVSVSAVVSSTKADISIAMSCPSTALANGHVTCTITVTNHGPASAKNVYAVAFLPSSLSSITVSTGGKLVKHTAVWTAATLASGASSTFTVSATAAARGTSTVTAVAFSSNPDPNWLNNLVLSTIKVS